MYFDSLITNMMMKIPANLIFKIKTEKLNLKKLIFQKFFHFILISVDLRGKFFLQKL